MFGLTCLTWDLLLLSTGFSLVVAHGLQSAWAQYLQLAGLVAPMACGILVLRPGMEPTSPALESRFLTTGLQGKSPTFVFYVTYHPMRLAGHVYYHQSTGKETHT